MYVSTATSEKEAKSLLLLEETKTPFGGLMFCKEKKKNRGDEVFFFLLLHVHEVQVILELQDTMFFSIFMSSCSLETSSFRPSSTQDDGEP
jgi:hypothetical protein